MRDAGSVPATDNCAVPATALPRPRGRGAGNSGNVVDPDALRNGTADLRDVQFCRKRDAGGRGWLAVFRSHGLLPKAGDSVYMTDGVDFAIDRGRRGKGQRRGRAPVAAFRRARQRLFRRRVWSDNAPAPRGVIEAERGWEFRTSRATPEHVCSAPAAEPCHWVTIAGHTPQGLGKHVTAALRGKRDRCRRTACATIDTPAAAVMMDIDSAAEPHCQLPASSSSSSSPSSSLSSSSSSSSSTGRVGLVTDRDAGACVLMVCDEIVTRIVMRIVTRE